MKPPPPIPATNGSVTPSTAFAATAASTALPPARRILIPACVASGSTDATAPPVPTATACFVGCGAAGARTLPATSATATARTAAADLSGTDRLLHKRRRFKRRSRPQLLRLESVICYRTRKGVYGMRKILVFAAAVATLVGAGATAAVKPASVTISLSRPSVVYGASVKLSGLISSHQANQKVTVLAEPFGTASFAEVATLDTAKGGAWSYSASPLIQTRYKAQWKATSRVVTVNVRPRIALTLQSRTSSKGTFSVKVSGNRSFAGKYVLVQRLSSSGASTVRHVVLGAGSSATFSVRLPSNARLRAVMPT